MVALVFVQVARQGKLITARFTHVSLHLAEQSYRLIICENQHCANYVYKQL